MERKVLNQLVETSTPREGLIHVDSHIAVMLRRPQGGSLIYYYYTNVALKSDILFKLSRRRFIYNIHKNFPF